MQRVGALAYGLGADEPTYTPLATPLGEMRMDIFNVSQYIKHHLIIMRLFVLYV